MTTHKTEEFPWGRVIEQIKYNFDGDVMTVTKYHPHTGDSWTITNEIDNDLIRFHCDELNESSRCVKSLVISWFAYKSLGLNHGALASGIVRALNIKP